MREPIDVLRTTVAALPLPPEALAPLAAKTRERAYTVTDSDIADAKAAGFDDDAIFEVLVQAAVSEGQRRLDRANEVLG